MKVVVYSDLLAKNKHVFYLHNIQNIKQLFDICQITVACMGLQPWTSYCPSFVYTLFSNSSLWFCTCILFGTSNRLFSETSLKLKRITHGYTCKITINSLFLPIYPHHAKHQTILNIRKAVIGTLV